MKSTIVPVGMCVPLGKSPDSSTENIAKNYESMEELWNNKNKHAIFIIHILLPGTKMALPAIKKYCQLNTKTLFVDTHKCLSPACTLKPNPIPIVNLKGECVNSNLIEPFKEKYITLYNKFYNNLLKMAKMNLRSLYYESIPVRYNHQKSRLESIYGDTIFLRDSFFTY